MNGIKLIKSCTVVMPAANIDTDQIIPGRFLTTTEKTGLGQHLFADWRYDKDGLERSEFILNQPAVRGCRILVAGPNIGCGSSREHAPWALLDYGFQAVISTQIADIFRNNSLKNGLVPVIVEPRAHAWLLDHPGAEVEIDIEAGELRMGSGGTAGFTLEEFARYCLLNGIDELGYLLAQESAIESYEARLA
ncbi:MAG: 3-isopropylmalate dehydratase small subunit [Steroidobacteraceae bacterium]